jgi:hypothetical protein
VAEGRGALELCAAPEEHAHAETPPVELDQAELHEDSQHPAGELRRSRLSGVSLERGFEVIVRRASQITEHPIQPGKRISQSELLLMYM